MSMSHLQNVKQNHNINIPNESIENVAQFKELDTTQPSLGWELQFLSRLLPALHYPTLLHVITITENPRPLREIRPHKRCVRRISDG
jgi:hypothetical protein